MHDIPEKGQLVEPDEIPSWLKPGPHEPREPKRLRSLSLSLTLSFSHSVSLSHTLSHSLSLTLSVPACLCLSCVLLFLPGVLLRVAFCGWGHTALSRCQTVLAHAFPKGVTHSAHQSSQPRPLPVSRAASRAAALPLCAFGKLRSQSRRYRRSSLSQVKGSGTPNCNERKGQLGTCSKKSLPCPHRKPSPK